MEETKNRFIVGEADVVFAVFYAGDDVVRIRMREDFEAYEVLGGALVELLVSHGVDSPLTEAVVESVNKALLEMGGGAGERVETDEL